MGVTYKTSASFNNMYVYKVLKIYVNVIISWVLILLVFFIFVCNIISKKTGKVNLRIPSV